MRGPSPGGANLELLQLAVEKGESVALRALEEVRLQAERTGRMLQLGIASIAGALAVIGLVASRVAPLPAVPIVLLGVAVFFLLTAALLLIWTFTGFGGRRSVAIGPDLGSLGRAVEDPKWQAADLLASHLRHLALDVEHNRSLAQRITQRQVTALYLLATGTALVLMAVGYILGV